jgi:4-amino-4-deoxy-L-arabinose transferase-like glycosyltransferase
VREKKPGLTIIDTPVMNGNTGIEGKNSTLRQWLALILFTAVCLIPFCNKAFHIDDTLFLYAAKHIQSNPTDPYGLSVNWYGSVESLSQVMKNPPLNCYFIALVAYFTGWSETALHLAFFIPALAVILGTYRVAGFFCKNAMVAAFLTLLSPAFLVSGTTVMCDVPMLAFWIWAVVLWVTGIEKNNFFHLIAASILIALSALTKYYGMCLIPLLFIYTVIKKRGLGWWMIYLLVPVAVLGWYQYATYTLYGRGLLLDATEYATRKRAEFGAANFSKVLIGMVFTGGCFLSVFIYGISMKFKRWIMSGSIFAIVVVTILLDSEKIGRFPLSDNSGDIRWFLILQVGIFAAVGVGLFVLAIKDVIKHRDADSALLFLWITGTLLFAAYFNWTVNVRSILPLIPAASILLIRRIEEQGQPQKPQLHEKKKKNAPPEPAKFLRPGPGQWIIPLIPLALITLWVAYADFNLANSARTMAAEIRRQYTNNRIFFEGHWGFQYYMEMQNGKAVNLKDTRDIAPGDIIVVPVNNTNVRPIPKEIASPLPEIKTNACKWLTTMSSRIGAGFYTDAWGPLPFAFADVPPERYVIYQVNSRQY